MHKRLLLHCITKQNPANIALMLCVLNASASFISCKMYVKVFGRPHYSC